MIEIDDIDKSILDVIKNNSRLSTIQISKRTGIPSATVNRRMRKMIKNEIIKNFSVVLNYEKLGLKTAAYILIRSSPGADFYVVLDEVIKYPGVEDIASITGPLDIIIKVRVKDTDELSRFIFNFVRNIPMVSHTETLLVLNPKRTKKKK